MREHFLELIRIASTRLPKDVLDALSRWRDREEKGSIAHDALTDVLKNCELAKNSSRPICQDTGTNIWHVHCSRAVCRSEIEKDIIEATREATKKVYLRPNAVDSITGKNSGDNTGVGAPVVHFHEWERKEISAELLLKGGGCENVSAQYSLPFGEIGAGRDLEGVRRVVIDAVFNAQGLGCAPGIIGVGTGGDRASGMEEAKEQLFRILSDTNPNPTLADLEDRLMRECNELEIGPMGFGGKTTVLGVKIGARHRLPASFFVSIAYMCWACRRASVTIEGTKTEFSEIGQIARRYKIS